MDANTDFTSRLELFAHKLKNPTHSIGINLEVLKTKISKLHPELAAENLKLVEIMAKELTRLNLIVQRFTEFWAPAGLSQERVKISTLLALTRAATEPLAQTRQVTLSVQPPPQDVRLRINLNEITFALEQLICNAIEASSPGQQVTVQLQLPPAQVIFSIQDNGPGIPSREISKIFELFYTTRKDHVGMGLPLAQKFITANGGQILPPSTSGGGTRMQVIFQV
ncbi:HAMP domain-containing histidine kinase [candidate division KSB1 bacterium]|nr:HAMP domain-containing histidine kinase [candidate division KSB1 bacterium]